MSQTKLNFLKRSVYKLKRSYGVPVQYYQVPSHDIVPETGVKTTGSTLINVSRAVVLRSRQFRSFVYDLAYISANKDFTEGGFFDPEDRRVLFDKKDLKGITPTADDYMIINNSRYDVKEVLSFEEDSAFICLARKIRGGVIVRDETTLSVLNLTQTVSVIKGSNLEQNVISELDLTQELLEVT